MAETLSAVGFTMVGGAAQLNLDDEKFRQVLKEFGEQLEEADIGLFYYAGHGVKGEDTNYLVPINATFNKPPDPIDDRGQQCPAPDERRSPGAAQNHHPRRMPQ